MKFRNTLLLLAWLSSVSIFVSVQAQKRDQPTEGSTSNSSSEKLSQSFGAAAEELVRAAYAKVTRYNKAFLLVDGRRDQNLPVEEAYLRFELNNFKVGPIQEILNLPHSEVRTNTPEEIDLIRSVNTLNGSDPHVAYTTQWRLTQYASGYDPRWTINDLLSHDPSEYHDVGGYASYDVTLRLNGKIRKYRALTLFHNPYASVEKLKPSFWDPMVGSAGAMRSLWYEQRPAVGEPERAETVAPPPEQLVRSVRMSKLPNSRRSAAKVIGPTSRTINPLSTTETSSDTPTLGPIVENTTEDRTEHSSGAHGERITFQGSCTATTSSQVCKVNFNFIYLYENGAVTNLFYRHKNQYDYVLGTSTGPRGTAISCYSAYGVATKNCLGDCTFSATLVGSGLSMQMTGGDVWRGQVVHGHTCNIRAVSGGGGGCNLPTVEIIKARKAPAPNLVNPYCCDAVEQASCINGGGEWTDSTCSCYSPIVIDVAGNGFNLTSAIGGVMFDLNAVGSAEKISWTAENSDDAWLVLDRNGNGVIDNGRELFGSTTPQPYLAAGESKNGFRALAVFDERENGGNGDGQIDDRDAVFSSLMVWQDRNHNGISEAGELQSLAAADIRAIELKYRESRRQDENGNWFRYRAKVNNDQGAEIGQWAWDVFLQRPH